MSKASILNQFWLEFIEWASERHRWVEAESQGWDIATKWEKTWTGKIMSAEEAEALGLFIDDRVKPADLIKTYSDTFCTLKINEPNFWLWYVRLKKPALTNTDDKEKAV